jgi:hypothetical protein
VDERRARRRCRDPVSIPASSIRGPGNGDPRTTSADARRRTSAGDDHIELEGLNLDEWRNTSAGDDRIELEGLNLDEWRNDVHRNAPGTGMRRRPRVVPDTDEGSIITTLDEVCLFFIIPRLSNAERN